MVNRVSSIPVATRTRGFTLVELLATLVLVAVVLPAAMKGISLATTTAGVTRNKIIATNLADNKMTDLLITEAWLDGDQSGDFDQEGYPQYEWKTQVTDWQGVTVQQLTVTVTWEYRNHEREVALSTLVYQEVSE